MEKITEKFAGPQNAKRYTESPYSSSVPFAKVFLPYALDNNGPLSNKKYTSRKMMLTLQNGWDAKYDQYWENVCDAVLGYYMLKYGSGAYKQYNTDIAAIDPKNPDPSSPFFQAIARSCRYMWGEWIPTQGYHRGIDYCIGGENQRRAGVAGADIFPLCDGVIVGLRESTPTLAPLKGKEHCFCAIVQSGNNYIYYTHLKIKDLKKGQKVSPGKSIGTEWYYGYVDPNKPTSSGGYGITPFQHLHLEFSNAMITIDAHGPTKEGDFSQDGIKTLTTTYNASKMSSWPYKKIRDIWYDNHVPSGGAGEKNWAYS